MPLPTPKARPKADPTLGLINVVFLMVMFFLIAGTLAAPPPPGINPVATAEADEAPPPDLLTVAADGTLLRGGVASDPESAWLELPEYHRNPVRLLPDRDAPAARVVEIARAFRDLGAESVVLVTDRGTAP